MGMRSFNLTMTTIWMTALLSLGARSCRGFRSSSSISIATATRWHRRGFNDAERFHSLIGDSTNGLRRNKIEGFRYNDSCRYMSSSSQTPNLITSSKSQTVKKIQNLLSKRKQRLKLGQTIVEGPRMVFDMLDNPKTKHLVKQILVSASDYELREDYQGLFEKSDDDDDILVQLVHPEIFPDCTDTITPQGIVAIVDIPESAMFEEKNDNIAPMYLVLDGVSDPGNLGTLLRSSLAVGVAGVILLKDCCDVWNPKSVRSAMGASFQIPILETQSWEDALELLHSKGNVQQIYAATMIEEGNEEKAAPSVSYFDVDWTDGPSALVIGSEGNGLSPVVRRDLLQNESRIGATHIPMAAGIESLNAAVCGSVILFEYARQQQQ